MENWRIKEKQNRQEFEHNLPGPTNIALYLIVVSVYLLLYLPHGQLTHTDGSGLTMEIICIQDTTLFLRILILEFAIDGHLFISATDGDTIRQKK